MRFIWLGLSPPPLVVLLLTAIMYRTESNYVSYHFRTFSIAAITRLTSSLALLRVSARTDLPDMTTRGFSNSHTDNSAHSD